MDQGNIDSENVKMLQASYSSFQKSEEFAKIINKQTNKNARYELNI